MRKQRVNHIKYRCDNPDCNKEFDMTEYRYNLSKHHFCSNECKNISNTIYNSGENHNNYRHDITKDERTKQCDWCGKSFEVATNKINKKQSFFCCRECQALWQSNIYTKIPKVKERLRNQGNLSVGLSSKTNSHCQRMIDDLLNKMNIKYEREKLFKYYSVDVYLSDSNLVIEVMGDYFHTNPIKNKIIKDEKRYETIFQDKSRRTYLKRYKNIDILYLWEYDIEHNISLCEGLISQYINNDGDIPNYHSFNYTIHNNKVILNSEIIKSYFELTKNKIDELVKYNYVRKFNRKDPEKHITFNCEYCGKETKQSKYNYDKCKTHCCSYDCRHKLMEKKLPVVCSTCGKTFEIIPVIFNKNKTKQFYCCRECYEKRSDIFETICNYCGNKLVIKKFQTTDNTTGLHFCNRECRTNYNKVEMVKLSCSTCGIIFYKRPSAIKDNKTGNYFCNKECKEIFDSIRFKKINKEDNPSKYKLKKNKSA